MRIVGLAIALVAAACARPVFSHDRLARPSRTLALTVNRAENQNLSRPATPEPVPRSRYSEV
jgi:hypothetical protein